MGNADLPVASGEAHARAFERCGWQRLDRRGRGKHILLSRPGHPHVVSLPDQREVKRALLAAQLKAAGISFEYYVKRFKK